MTVVKAGNKDTFSGKVGNLVVVSRGETTYLRSMPNYTKDSWTPKQARTRKRFSIVSKFCMGYKLKVIVPIWNLLPGNACGYSQFLGSNSQAFDSEGFIGDWSMLQFSNGSLPPPLQVTAERVGDQITVGWVNDPNTAPDRLNDELWLMALAGDRVDGPVRTSLSRGMQGGVVAPLDPSARALYLFFATPDRKAFSPDRFVAI